MEREFIAWLQKTLHQRDDVLVPPGDDAAVLRVGGDLVVTTDMLMDGVDFVVGEASFARIGRKSLAVNLSDLAAMAARPTAAFVSLAWPRALPQAALRELYLGMEQLAAEFDVSIAGGDTNTWPGPLAISVTALGEVTSRGALLRSGARPGDAVVVTGSFGYSILGKHFDFTPRVHEALAWRAQFELHAATDVSDGLSLDLAHIAEASGVGATIDAGAIPLSPHAAGADPKDALRRALTDGEDFELILAVAPHDLAALLAAAPLAAHIGWFTRERHLVLRNERGEYRPLVPQGYEHRLEGS